MGIKQLIEAHMDKVKHFLGGMVIGLIALVDFFIGLGIVMGIAAGKEIYDYVSGKGTPEFLDFVATVAGYLVVALIIMVL